MTEPQGLDALLRESSVVHNELAPFASLDPLSQDARASISRGLSRVSLEHAGAIIELAASGRYTSSVSLLRLQYEAFLRGVWTHYAASDSMVSRLASTEPPARTERLPTLNEMVSALDGRAPANLAKSLREFQDHSWRPLSSYVHGGVHSLLWNESGFPGWLILQTVRSSNGLKVFACLHLAELAGRGDLAIGAAQMAAAHARIMPPSRRPTSAST